jgi:hypothetical protein
VLSQNHFTWAKPACFDFSSSNFYCAGSHTRNATTVKQNETWQDRLILGITPNVVHARTTNTIIFKVMIYICNWHPPTMIDCSPPTLLERKLKGKRRRSLAIFTKPWLADLGFRVQLLVIAFHFAKCSLFFNNSFVIPYKNLLGIKRKKKLH